ncbi:AraC family transcriptional regulator [Rhizobium sp. SSA_523]|uniref:AraC family transcriptional regulator n=1 Tax=Rhizobium sp. SSA_523 TaxID=2952477 RepID=UPI0020901F94|nr:AraC family transcriptional regulator [Rhizobium sp. SSA_523]MCO5734214.1 AraC family transcriptional regulator [Rhizobium sp. SSA_523]WKC21507.1 AraC family transcriptional regulator [Rhizobium sp. SSA_523]
MEITLALQGTRSGIVQRCGNGDLQKTPARTGTLWFCPVGVQEDSIRLTEAIPQVLHLYLPEEPFRAASELASRPGGCDSIAYLADVQDEFVRQICQRILLEMRCETAAGDMLVEQLSMALTLHLLSSYSGNFLPRAPQQEGAGALSKERRQRVIDYVETYLETDFTVAELASVACLSRYHFTRAFKATLGKTPSDYVADRRLDHARLLLEEPGISLSDIAFRCRFSSQAAFSRAFRRHVGLTPGAYRRTKR